MADRPAAEIELSTAIVRGAVERQFPELSGLPIAELARGWDNTNFRLGDDHIVRIPHRQAAAQLILNEQRTLAAIAERVDLAIPVPTHHGVPDQAIPWHWSITPWFDGEIAAGAELRDPEETAATFGTFLSQVHQPAPADAPANPYRGIPLQARADSFASQIMSLETKHDKAQITAVYAAALDAPIATERVWLHGDLHTRNIIVNHGDLSAVIDWGDICAGDPATDLAGAFMLVPDHIDAVRSIAGGDDATWTRARGWATHFAIVYLLNGGDDPIQHSIGTRLLDTLLEPAR